MADVRKKKGLGKGLGALIGEKSLALEDLARAGDGALLSDGSRLLELDPREIRPNPKQPRRGFDEAALEELAESIRRDGMQEPVIVRRVDDTYELVSGERRVRACIMADVERIAAIYRDVSDHDMLKLGLIENIQREDLNPIELAYAYQQLLEELECTQEELGGEVGKKRVTVTNTLRLLNLPEVVQEQVADGSLTMGHAKALLALASPAAQMIAARKIIKEGLSVRQAERLADGPKTRKKRTQPRKDPNIVRIEDELRRSLGTRVALKVQNAGRGKIEIEYFSADELERLLDFLRGRR